LSEAILVPPGGGEIIGDSADRRVEILSDDETVHATWSRFAPGRDGADLHVHRRHSDLFYVLGGQLTVRLGVADARVLVAPGRLARVPPLVVHGFRNGGDADLRYLNFHAPGEAFADYLRAVRDGRPFSYDQHPPPADGGRPPTDAVVGSDGLVAEHGGERIALLADVDAIGIAEVWSEPGKEAPPQHVHHRHTESYYVLEGELTFTAGARELRAAAGSWVQIPAGLPHTLMSTGSGPARFLDVHTPGCGFGAYVRRLHDARTEDAEFDQAPA
jgi:mannose-6-phosphate isomerase-like protein (cupin superfamily)